MTDPSIESEDELVIALTPKQIAVVAVAILVVLLLRRCCRIS